VAISVSPASANLLTCKTASFTATVTGATDTSVAWSVAPTPAGGSIGTDGTYSAPLAVPAQGSATVTATSHADPLASASAHVALATIHPGTPAILPVVAGADTEQYHHRVATGGSLGYAVRSNADANASALSSVQVSVSTNGGSTWGASKNIFDADPTTVATVCASAAVDPGDPTTAYVLYFDDGVGCTSSTSGTANGSRWILAVTKDGGTTFTKHVLANGEATQCPDVVAPSPGHVVVIGAGVDSNDMYFTVFASATKGDDLVLPSSCQTPGFAPNATLFDTMFVHVGVNGGNGYGAESPRLFSDGKGDVCVAFEGTLPSGTVDVPWVSCSGDNGATWSTPVQVSTDTSADAHLTQGAFGAGGEITVAWLQEDGTGAGSSTVRLATSPGLGSTGPKPFGAVQRRPQFVIPETMANAVPTNFTLAYEMDVLVVAQGFGHDFTAHLVVDKTCDPNQTIWSGAQVVNAPAGGTAENTFNMDRPTLQFVGGALTAFAYDQGTNQIAQASLEP
jgi:hypothetical protein